MLTWSNAVIAMLLVTHVSNVALHVTEPSVNSMSNGLLRVLLNGRSPEPPRPPAKIESELISPIVNGLFVNFYYLPKTHLNWGRCEFDFGKIKYHWRMITAQMDRIITWSPHNVQAEFFTSAKNINLVISTSTVNFHSFNLNKVNNLSGPCHKIFRDNKSVGDCRSYHNECVYSGTTIDKCRSLIEITVSVWSGSSKSVSQVSNFLSIFSVFFKNKERLQHKPVIPGPAMKEDLGPVKIDIHCVVLVPPEYKKGIWVSIRHVACISDRNPFRIFKCSVSCIRNSRDCANGDSIITGPCIHHSHSSCIIE